MLDEQVQQTFDRGQGFASFDRIHGGLEGLPGYKSTKPSTVIDAMPIIGTRTAYIVQSFRTNAHGFVVSLEIMDAAGQVRIIMPNKVAQAIYRQRQSLADRSTPTSRQRDRARRERARKRAEKAKRRERYANGL